MSERELYLRPMMRCNPCGRWWSVEPVNPDLRCPCGGTLEPFDLQAHTDALPYAPYDPSKDPSKKGT